MFVLLKTRKDLAVVAEVMPKYACTPGGRLSLENTVDPDQAFLTGAHHPMNAAAHLEVAIVYPLILKFAV